jgi:hypothetical protein
LYWRQEQENWRVTVFFTVLLLHLIVGAILVRSSRLLSAARTAPEEFLIAFLRSATEQNLRDASPAHTKADTKAISPAKRPASASAANKSAVQPDSSFDTQSEATLLLPIDWAHEAELAVQGQLAAAERENLYRNLAGLSAAQLDWIQKNRMVGVDTNPPWAENRPKNNADGVLWISDNCALVNGLPFCRIKLGREAPRGDLFKNMRQYLDKRLTDPLP